MHKERTNLLPPERQRALRRDYFLRLGTVICAFLIALTCAAAALLLPMYVFLTKSADAKKARLASIESVTSSSDEAALSAQLAALSKNATALAALATAPSASGIIRETLAIPRPGITLAGFGYAIIASKNPDILTISGTATTRDALRNYQLALEGASFALAADLPVSAYAKDSDIPFTITVTLAP